MLTTEVVLEDEYLLHFDKEYIDEKVGYADPDSPHHLVLVSIKVSGREDRRAVAIECACGRQTRMGAVGRGMTYAQMIIDIVLEAACAGSSRLRQAGLVAPDDLSSLDLDPTAP